ncbi:MAG: hypothetical protein MZW92_49905 [Comamonadaceae bacterium]|nr:hypothetical protein [Comamonadaceae bacterium]
MAKLKELSADAAAGASLHQPRAGSGTKEVTDDYLRKSGVSPDSLNLVMELGSPEALEGGDRDRARLRHRLARLGDQGAGARHPGHHPAQAARSRAPWRWSIRRRSSARGWSIPSSSSPPRHLKQAIADFGRPERLRRAGMQP